MEKIKEIRRKETIALVVYGVILVVICIIAHNVAFHYATIQRGGRTALGGEMFVVPFILLGALALWNLAIKPYFENLYFEVEDVMACFDANPCINHIIDLNSDGEKIGTYYKLVDGRVVYMPCKLKK